MNLQNQFNHTSREREKMKVSLPGLLKRAGKNVYYKQSLSELLMDLRGLKDKPESIEQFFEIYVFDDRK